MEISRSLPDNASLYINLDQLECMFGDDFSNPPEEVLAILESLIQQTFAAFQEVNEHWDSLPLVDRTKKIHRMRGTIVNFGLTQLCQLLEKVEHNPTNLTQSELKIVFAQSFEVFVTSVNLLKTIFPQLKSK